MTFLGSFIIIMSLVATPFIIFELIKKEVDIIKQNLFRQLLNCTGNAFLENVQIF